MKFSAQLDVNVVAHESDDEVALLLDLAAPAPADTAEARAPAALQVVLDRSGSMSGAPLDGAIAALTEVVRRLEGRDSFGVVAFDDAVQVVVPAGPLADKDDVIARIRAITPGGMTDLSGGYLRGLQEATRVAGDAGATVLLISDGHANAGIVDPGRLGDVARKAHGDQVVTSTIGYGLGYDETLLDALTRGGSGNHYFADDPDAAGAAIGSEVTGLLTKTVQAASLTLSLSPEVELMCLYNDLPSTRLDDGRVMVELGDFFSEEQRRLLMTFKVPAMAALGAAEIARLELMYVELPRLKQHMVSWPVSVNVVPGDEAAGRVPDPTVRTEVLYHEMQRSKLEASLALERGDRHGAKTVLDAALSGLADAVDGLGADPSDDDLRRQRAELESLATSVDHADIGALSKQSRMSHHLSSRKRGRRPSTQD